jgi:hypothetical protein
MVIFCILKIIKRFGQCIFCLVTKYRGEITFLISDKFLRKKNFRLYISTIIEYFVLKEFSFYITSESYVCRYFPRGEISH